ncbi:hypothetical protein CR513_03338, partial [Mucuna pruriens]
MHGYILRLVKLCQYTFTLHRSPLYFTSSFFVPWCFSTVFVQARVNARPVSEYRRWLPRRDYQGSLAHYLVIQPLSTLAIVGGTLQLLLAGVVGRWSLSFPLNSLHVSITYINHELNPYQTRGRGCVSPQSGMKKFVYVEDFTNIPIVGEFSDSSSFDVEIICMGVKEGEDGVKKKFHRFKLNKGEEVVQFELGRIFATKDLVRIVVNKYAIGAKKDVYLAQNDSKKVVVKSPKSCSFYIRVSQSNHHSYFKVVTLDSTHTC